MHLSRESAVELGQLIALGCHTLTYDQSRKFIGNIADSIKDLDARIEYCRAFREKLEELTHE